MEPTELQAIWLDGGIYPRGEQFLRGLIFIDSNNKGDR